MQNKNLLQKLMLFVFAALISGVAKALPIVNVTSNITTNTTWTNNKIYVLQGYIYVTNNKTLTIEPGTVIYGNNGLTKGALIVTRGAKIQAVGTPCRPIVFTSGVTNPKKRKRGDWGGLIILGYAQINPPGDTAHIEGITPIPETLYGGGKNQNCGGGDCPDDADNSGTLQYVRIEYGGVALSPNNEINGLTLGAVGSGTTIDHIQVSYANDDSYEWFGGTVNAKYIIAYRGLDDDFDTDFGYSGKVQFGVSLRDPAVADVSQSHGFESDNNGIFNCNNPKTSAVFSNMTVDAGGDVTQNHPLYEAGVFLRRCSQMHLYNSVVMGWDSGIEIRDYPSTLGTGIEDNVIGVANSAYYVIAPDPPKSFLLANNNFYPGNTQILLFKPYNLNAPDFRPKPASPAKTGADFTHHELSDPFFTVTTYRGALAPQKSQDWTKEKWVNWRPDTTDYSNGVNCNNAPSSEIIQAATATASVKVSPNPNKGSFSIEASGFANNIVTVKISDLNSGKVYYNGKINNNNTSNISLHIPNGNYAVELTDGKTVATRKIVVLN